MDTMDYQLINTFKDKVTENLLDDSNSESFRQRVSRLMEEIFHYEHIIFGYLDGGITRKLDLVITTHNLSNEFIQKFYTAVWSEYDFLTENDITVYSSRFKYKQRTIYREILTNYGFSDFLLFYLKNKEEYIGYIIIFRESSSGIFQSRDIQIVESIRFFLGNCYKNTLIYLNLSNMNNMLITQNNNYPIGVVIMENYSDYIFSNSLAEDYMNELGIGDPKYFGMFFSNELLPHIKHQLLTIGHKCIVRHKNFVFSLITYYSPHGTTIPARLPQTFPKIPHLADLNLRLGNNILTYIYILRDDLTSHAVDTLCEFEFSKKEEMIVKLISYGKSNKQIAAEMGISINTVRVHIQSIYRKAGVNSRTELLFLINSKDRNTPPAS